jgi:hypothetical protein
MERSDGVIRGTVDSLMKLIAALRAAGVELIGEGEASGSGGRGVRLRETAAIKRVRTPAQARQRGAHSPLPVAGRGRAR